MKRERNISRVRKAMDLDPSRLKSLIFDVDGTLYSQEPLRRAMLLKLLKEALSKPVDVLATLRGLRAYRQAQELLRSAPDQGSLAATQIRLACKNSGQPEQVLSAIVSRWMQQEPLPLLERFVSPALRNFLDTARNRGLRMGILSDYPAEAKLNAMHLSDYFEVLVTAQDPAVNCFKPHPRGLVETMRRLNVNAGEALYIGDRYDVDGRAAFAAGVSCVVIGGRKATYDGCISVPDYGALHTLLFSSNAQTIH